MRKRISIDQDEKLKSLAKKAAEANSIANGIYEEIRKLTFKDKDFLSFAINAADSTGNIKTLLEELTNGSPQPFYHSVSVTGTLKEEEVQFGLNGTGSQEYPDDGAAVIGGAHFEKDELIRFRDWINSVIEWHQRY